MSVNRVDGIGTDERDTGWAKARPVHQNPGGTNVRVCLPKRGGCTLGDQADLRGRANCGDPHGVQKAATQDSSHIFRDGVVGQVRCPFTPLGHHGAAPSFVRWHDQSVS